MLQVSKLYYVHGRCTTGGARDVARFTDSNDSEKLSDRMIHLDKVA